MRAAEQRLRPPAHEAVRRAVEAVAPDAVARVEHVGQAVEKSLRRHRLVICRVEHQRVRYVGHDAPGGFVAAQVGRHAPVAERRKMFAQHVPHKSRFRKAEFKLVFHIP